MTQGHLDRDSRVRDAIYRSRVLVNRTPHFSRQTRREANRALEILDGQLGLNQVNAAEAARGIELLNRAHPSLTFGLLRMDEVPSSVMALPIPGPIGEREHRDELPPDERLDAEGRPLPPPPGFY
jgi:hypothetical protein